MDDEYLDIVDENDNVIGKELRSKIYEKSLSNNVRVVNIFILNSKNELLVPLRSNNRKLFPNCFNISCGEHVMSGEDYYSAAIRGLKEELGINNIELFELGKLTLKDNVNCFMKVYKGIYDENIINYDANGISNLNWFSLEKVKDMIMQNPKQFNADFPIIFRKYFS